MHAKQAAKKAAKGKAAVAAAKQVKQAGCVWWYPTPSRTPSIASPSVGCRPSPPCWPYHPTLMLPQLGLRRVAPPAARARGASRARCRSARRRSSCLGELGSCANRRGFVQPGRKLMPEGPLLAHSQQAALLLVVGATSKCWLCLVASVHSLCRNSLILALLCAGAGSRRPRTLKRRQPMSARRCAAAAKQY